MSGIYLPDLKAIARSACDHINAGGDAAVTLIVGTILCENGSNTLNLFQRTNNAPTRGIAWGPSQMEPATHDDCWRNFINYRSSLKSAMMTLVHRDVDVPDATQLIYDLRYACAMTRVRYLRDKHSIPANGDDSAMAAYWKRVYNTSKGSGVADRAHADLFKMARESKETDVSKVTGMPVFGISKIAVS